MTKFDSIAQVRALNKSKGYHFFDRGAMNFFNSRIEALYRGRFLLTSEQFNADSKRGYTLRVCTPDGEIEGITEFNELSKQQCKDWIIELYKLMGNREKEIIENLETCSRDYDFSDREVYNFSSKDNSFLLDVDNFSIIG